MLLERLACEQIVEKTIINNLEKTQKSRSIRQLLDKTANKVLHLES